MDGELVVTATTRCQLRSHVRNILMLRAYFTLAASAALSCCWLVVGACVFQRNCVFQRYWPYSVEHPMTKKLYFVVYLRRMGVIIA